MYDSEAKRTPYKIKSVSNLPGSHNLVLRQFFNHKIKKAYAWKAGSRKRWLLRSNGCLRWYLGSNPSPGAFNFAFGKIELLVRISLLASQISLKPFSDFQLPELFCIFSENLYI